MLEPTLASALLESCRVSRSRRTARSTRRAARSASMDGNPMTTNSCRFNTISIRRPRLRTTELRLRRCSRVVDARRPPVSEEAHVPFDALCGRLPFHFADCRTHDPETKTGCSSHPLCCRRPSNSDRESTCVVGWTLCPTSDCASSRLRIKPQGPRRTQVVSRPARSAGEMSLSSRSPT